MDITFKEYSKDDLDEISALFFDTVHTVCAKDYTPPELSAWAPDDLPSSKCRVTKAVSFP